MAFHTNYWSCSKFADWIRGTDKIPSGTSREWRDWRKSSMITHPIRHWIAEELLDKIQDYIYYPHTLFNSIRYYINNRWVTKSHALTAHRSDIKPGNWHDVGYRFLPCLFNELVDFVEIEQASHHVLWDDAASKEFNPPWWRTTFFKWRTWRSPAAGLAYLEWASTLRMNDDWVDKTHPEYGNLTCQALVAIEIKELYHWWIDIYPNRPEPYEISGWSEICSRSRDEDGWMFDRENETLEEVDERDAVHKLLQKIQAEYEQEEEVMLIRLIKIRKSLCT